MKRAHSLLWSQFHGRKFYLWNTVRMLLRNLAHLLETFLNNSIAVAQMVLHGFLGLKKCKYKEEEEK
jgi:hypothetical protein